MRRLSLIENGEEPDPQDRADQRYYAAGRGRFLTADPYVVSGGPADAQSWNRYSYVEADAANRTDASGCEASNGSTKDFVKSCLAVLCGERVFVSRESCAVSNRNATERSEYHAGSGPGVAVVRILVWR